MPDEYGYHLIRKIRARPPEHGGKLPAIALTALAQREDREAALDAGFEAHMRKPVQPRVRDAGPDLLDDGARELDALERAVAHDEQRPDPVLVPSAGRQVNGPYRSRPRSPNVRYNT